MGELLHPLEIGNVRLPNNLVLSPMAGFSDHPFRVLCRRHGAGLVCSEMVAAGSFDRAASRYLLRAHTTEEERPTSIQLFGTEEEPLARAAREAEADCDVLGFNMGCPAHQIQSQGCGAALLDHPERAESIVGAIKSASRRPLLVKIRAGNKSTMDVVGFARRLERAGADAILFHARTAAQYYSGRSDWGLIRAVKAAVGIPVVGNGDVVDGPSAARLLEESGADGVALGRATLGDPRIFRRIAAYLETGQRLPAPTLEQRVGDFLEYLRMAEPLGLGTPRILQQAQRFTRGLRGGAEIRSQLQGGRSSLASIRQRFEGILEGPMSG